MKRNTLIILIIFQTFNLFSQINKGNFIISTNGSYVKSNTENGVSTNSTYIQGRYLNISLSGGYMLTDGFVIGAGIDYNWGKEKRLNNLHLNNFSQSESMDIKSTSLLPCLYLGYYYQIINKLYISANLKFNYGKIKSSMDAIYSSMTLALDSILVVPGVNGSASLSEYKTDSKLDIFSAKAYPELVFFISNKFSLFLEPGGIEYSILDWKNDNSSWVVSFKPDFWRLGIKVRI